MDRIEINVDDRAFSASLRALQQRLADLSPLTEDIGELLLESTRKRFETGTAPDGTPWLPLADGSGRTPLTLTGTMSDQIFPSSGPDFVEIAATAKQARWHQEGTEPYVIEPREGVALKFAGPNGPVFAKRVNHPGLAARPFMGLSDSDDSAIGLLINEYLDLGAN
jgi:phage gpG-like protein